jgi:hypothetical protein
VDVRNSLLVIVFVVGTIVGVALTSFDVLPVEAMAMRAQCADCHDLHAAIEWAEAPFQSQVWVLGDVPTNRTDNPPYVFVNDLFPYRNDLPNTQITLLDLLAMKGVESFERVALESLDGGIVVLEREHVTEEAVLLPYMEGIRFRDEHQHESNWLVGVRWITVVGAETPLTIDGVQTSLGRLLINVDPESKEMAYTRDTVIADGGQSTFKSRINGQLYKGFYAHTFTGARLRDVVGHPDFSRLMATDTRGKQFEIPAEKARQAIIGTSDGRPTLVLPADTRLNWVVDVVEIVSYP